MHKYSLYLCIQGILFNTANRTSFLKSCASCVNVLRQYPPLIFLGFFISGGVWIIPAAIFLRYVSYHENHFMMDEAISIELLIQQLVPRIHRQIFQDSCYLFKIMATDKTEETVAEEELLRISLYRFACSNHS